MATVTVPVDEFRKHLCSMMEQGVLLKFVQDSDLDSTDFPPDVLYTLMEKISAQNHAVLQWLHKLDSALFVE